MVVRLLGFIAYSLFVAAVVVVGVWSVDRVPPLRLISGQIVPPAVPGGLLTLHAQIERQVQRGCDVAIRAHVIDSAGRSTEVLAAELGADALARRESISPGRTRVVAPLPQSLATGPARLIVHLDAVCNPLHRAWRPISSEWSTFFEIQPAAAGALPW